MNANKFMLSAIFAICTITSLNAKVSYYYYNGERVPLTVSEDSVNAYVNQRVTKGDKEESVYIHRTISGSEQHKRSTTSEPFTSMEYFIKGDSTETIKMSNTFYVQLFDSLADIQTLQKVASETNTIIRGSIPYMPDWYELVVHNSTINNSLEMSNYFYETGLFKNVDPGFIFNFTPSAACVTDSKFSDQWGLPAIKACEAWNITTGSPDIKIAIIDYGVTCEHSEFTPSQFVDKYDCVTHSQSGYDVYGEHGTAVCGVIAADHNHAQIAGMTPLCKIMPISYFIPDTVSAAANLASGFAWAVEHGADVINCSWGDHLQYTWLHSTILESAIQNALDNGRNGKGCIVIFASGNKNTVSLDYPGRVFPEILTVGAINSDSLRWQESANPSQGSSFGYDLDVVAPGNDIYTTYYNIYALTTGTSIAAPHVSGIAGLMLSVNPYLTRQEVTDIIESTAVKVGNTHGTNYIYETTQGRPNGKWDFEMGYGLVDAYAAVMEAKKIHIRGPEVMCDTAKYYLISPSQPGETVSWSVHNGEMFNPHYSIIGPDDQDTVLIGCVDIADPLLLGNGDGMREWEFPNPNNPGDHFIDRSKFLSVTISDGTTSETYTKDLYHATSVTPIISASDTAHIWQGGTQRTFTITNCNSIPDSLLRWTVKNIMVDIFHPLARPRIIIQQYSGRTLSYETINIPSSRPSKMSIHIWATNLAGSCGEKESDQMTFVVVSSMHLLASIDDNYLNISILQGADDFQNRSAARLNENSSYTLELNHSIYGNMRVQPVYSTTEQVPISGLPSGVYVLSLRENGNIVAQTKINL